jgi:hypothetical protein
MVLDWVGSRAIFARQHLIIRLFQQSTRCCAKIGSAPLELAVCLSNRIIRRCLVVIVLIPIAFLVPAMLVFLPPLMPLTPATLPRIVQFTTLVICLSAVASVSLDCLVEFMVCMSYPALTSVESLCPKARHCGAKQNRCEND